MIRETIVTTVSEAGVVHIAPMGATPIEGGWLLQPFRPSATLENFLAKRSGCINFTDDARVFAGCVTKRRTDWPTVRAEVIDGERLEDALAHHEVIIEDDIDLTEDAQRPKLRCTVVHTANHRAFGGLNRAVAAVLEGAVLASRLTMLPPEKIAQEFAYLQIAIDKTAGPEEREAWGWLTEMVRAHAKRSAS